MEATWSQVARALGIASRDTIGVRLTEAKAVGVIVRVNDTAPRSVPRRYKVQAFNRNLARLTRMAIAERAGSYCRKLVRA